MSDPARPEPAARPTIGLTLLTAAMALPAIGPVHAETAPERGTIALKTLDYVDSQPANQRIRVGALALRIAAPISGDWLVGGTAVTDSISGASPAYHTTALTRMRDRRNAGTGEVTRYFEHGTLTVGASQSRESDYLSRGFSVLATRSGEDKKTTWSAGIGVLRDLITPTNHVIDRDHKKVDDLLLGVTQVLTPRDIVQLNAGLSFGHGYFSDPYKAVDNRPRYRNHATLTARWNHHFDAIDGTLRLSYRHYADTWAIRSHTLGAEFVQTLPGGWSVTPIARAYTQTAARFYIEAGPAGPFGPAPPAGAVFFSADQRLSAFGGRTYGLKIAKQIGPDWQADVKVERYEQRAAWTWYGPGSRGLAPFYARTVQVGLAMQF